MAPAVSTELQDRVTRQHLKNHHIPDIVIKLASNLQSVKYGGLIRSFAEEYYPKEFETIQDEFKAVRDFDCRLMEFCTDVSMVDELTRIMRADIVAAAASTALEKVYRDHFIHSFQDFLTGAILIDRFYSNLCKWYSSSLNDDIKTGIECAWLLTALFHDRFRPLLKLGELLDEKIPEKDKSNECANNLTSLYDHLKMGENLEDWAPEDNKVSSGLGAILVNHSALGNHAARAAFSLLNYDLPIAEPTIYAAALAISMHNRGPREDMLRANIFPVKMEQFPLAVLLMYVDAVQEWSRTVGSRDELVDIVISEKGVVFVMDFSSASANSRKAQEFAEIEKCVSSPISLGFKSSFSIGDRLVEIPSLE